MKAARVRYGVLERSLHWGAKVRERDRCDKRVSVSLRLSTGSVPSASLQVGDECRPVPKHSQIQRAESPFWRNRKIRILVQSTIQSELQGAKRSSQACCNRPVSGQPACRGNRKPQRSRSIGELAEVSRRLGTQEMALSAIVIVNELDRLYKLSVEEALSSFVRERPSVVAGKLADPAFENLTRDERTAS